MARRARRRRRPRDEAGPDRPTAIIARAEHLDRRKALQVSCSPYSEQTTCTVRTKASHRALSCNRGRTSPHPCSSHGRPASKRRRDRRTKSQSPRMPSAPDFGRPRPRRRTLRAAPCNWRTSLRRRIAGRHRPTCNKCLSPARKQCWAPGTPCSTRNRLVATRGRLGNLSPERPRRSHRPSRRPDRTNMPTAGRTERKFDAERTW